MSKYFTIKGLKVRVSDHEPNHSMDKFRGRNDIELYSKSADGQKLNIKNQIERFLESPLAHTHGLVLSDFNKVLGKKEKQNILKQEYAKIDGWFSDTERNRELINDLRINPKWFMNHRLSSKQQESWLNYLNKKLETIS